MSDRITLKSLSDEQIDKLSDLQMYNIMFGPLVEKRKMLDSYTPEQLDKTCIAVFGATSKKLIDRVQTKIDFVRKKKPAVVLFTGGYSWDGVGIKADGTHVKKWGESAYIDRIIYRSEEFNEDFSFLESRITDQMIGEYVGKVLEDMYEDKTLSEKLMALYNARSDEQNEESFVKWFSNKTKKEWLEKGLINNYTINQYIINRFAEADIMQMFWQHEMGTTNDVQIECDRKANNTAENAVNCVDVVSEKYGDVDTIAVVSEWPYLLRAVSTTNKPASLRGLKVLALPAEQFKYDKKTCMKLLRDEAKKIIKYDDVADIDITDFIKMKTRIKNGPEYGFDVDDVGGEI